MRQTRLVSDPHPTNYFLPSPFFSPGASPLESNFFPLPCTSSSIILQVQSRVLPGCLPAPRTAVTFMSNPRANSVVMFNHRGGKDVGLPAFKDSAPVNYNFTLGIYKSYRDETETKQTRNRDFFLAKECAHSSPFKLITNSVKHRIFLLSLPEDNKTTC